MGEKPEKPEDTFEQAMVRLEQVVRELELGERSLDEALALFQEGIELARRCAQRLDEAEGRIERLLELGSGQLSVKPLEGTELGD